MRANGNALKQDKIVLEDMGLLKLLYKISLISLKRKERKKDKINQGKKERKNIRRYECNKIRKNVRKL